MQIVSTGHNLHEISKPVFRKNNKNYCEFVEVKTENVRDNTKIKEC